jgi:hypothetical protein
VRTLGWVAAIAASGTLLVFSASASAFDIPSFTVTPTSTQAAGHPNLSVGITRSGADTEDIRDLAITLPPGIIGNPEAAQKCTRANFMADTCPAASQIGTAQSMATATGLDLPAVDGTVYVLTPDPTEAAALGIVLRPPLGIDKIFIVNSASAARLPNGDYALRNTSTNLPRQVFLAGVPIDITVNSLTLTLNGPGSAPGTFFLTNTTTCEPLSASVTAVDYNGNSVTKTAPYQATGCESVPFTPGMQMSLSTTRASALTAPIVTLTAPANENPLRQSHVKAAVARFPVGMGLDSFSALAIDTCPESDFQADTCPAGSDLGDASASVPPLPPDFTGDVYRLQAQPGEAFGFGLWLRGPRGLNANLRGFSTIENGRFVTTFPFQPQIPFTQFTLKLTRNIFVNPGNCGPIQTDGTLTGWSGAVADVSAQTTVTGCEHPRSASVLNVPMVPNFRQTISASQCAARGGATSTHGVPLALGSCNPPGYGPGTVAHQGSSSVGSSQYVYIAGNAEEGEEPDLAIGLNVSDIRDRQTDADYAPNGAGPDVTLVSKLRITDFLNGPNLLDEGTVSDLDFPVPVECAPTADPAVGSSCNIATSANGVLFGSIQGGNATQMQVFRVRLNDSGANGTIGDSDDRAFSQQGLVVR